MSNTNSSNISENKEKVPLFEISFLHDIFEILSRLEAGRDIENLSHKVLELKEKINQAKLEIEAAKGIDSTKEEQEAILNALQQHLAIKKNIVEKYKDFKT